MADLKGKEGRGFVLSIISCLGMSASLDDRLFVRIFDSFTFNARMSSSLNT